jgi:nucleotide-binding universal stress UspA family protein
MYKKILIATDGSEQARRATQHAVALAKQLGASVHAVFVVDTRSLAAAHSMVGATTPAYYHSLLEEWRKAGEAATADVVAEGMKHGVSVSHQIVEGTPAQGIVEAATKMSADLVVMGTHGRTSLGAFFLGSTAQSLVHHATVPVLLVR